MEMENAQRDLATAFVSALHRPCHGDDLDALVRDFFGGTADGIRAESIAAGVLNASRVSEFPPFIRKQRKKEWLDLLENRLGEGFCETFNRNHGYFGGMDA